jgi:signal transduction histidine kinase
MWRIAAFERRLVALEREPRPVLVVRLPVLERTAWRRGRRAARALERAATAAFSTAVARVLRADDLAAHDAGSDLFVAALVAPTRDGHPGATPLDVRSALARIAAAMEAATQHDVRTGWTTYDGATDRGGIAAVLERALARGAQERERYGFFSSLGHELRTPLSSIRGYLETLLDREVEPATRERFVRIAYNESLRLSRLVEGMFEISLLDLHAPVCMPPGHGSVSEALAAVRDACEREALARRMRLEIAESEFLPVAIDTDRLALVMVNLVGNAMKHGRTGGTVRVGIDASRRRTVLLIVDDDGPGIPAGDRERVFVLGTRGTTSAEGSGIGLALVRLMLECAGGRVDIGDSPLGGARFVVSLPRADP